MANYVITKSDGVATITINNATTTGTTYSLPYIGQNYIGFGQIMAENQLKMLENFYKVTPPSGAVRGQLWYDSSTSLLKVWTGEDPTDGVSFVPVTDDSAVVANLSLWKVVGPAGIDGLEIGTIGTPFNNLYVDNVFATNGEFETLFIGVGSNGVTHSTSSMLPVPTSTNNVTGISIGANANRFKESHIRNEYIYGTLNIGADSFASNYNIILKADSSIAHTLIPDATNPAHLGSATVSTKRFASVNASIINGLSLITDVVSSNLIPSADNTFTLGDVSSAFQQGFISEITTDSIKRMNGTSTIGESLSPFDTVYAQTFKGLATQTQYADLAERYEADAIYEAGTVVRIGGVKEITQTTWENDSEVFGVISTLPAVKMNSEAGSDDTHPYVALVGRVPVKVFGKVIKGQRLVSSNYSGVAKAATGMEPYNTIIGRALETKNTEDFGKILIAIGVK